MLGGPKGGIAGVEPQELLQSFDVAVGGALRIIRACLPALQRSETPTIAIISSRLGSISAQARSEFRDLDTSYAYRLSKAAQNMLVTSLAQEFGSSVRCWAVHPGTLSTARGRPGADKSPDEAAQQLRAELDSLAADSPRFLSLGGADLEW
jgi:NAD(P)-dependent dehydrogenase (short-subunit alcohol dehydrogenase family)